jgi:DNA-binding NtrC family response regulator
MKRSRILFLSGHLEDALRLSRMLESVPVQFDHTLTLGQARANLRRERYDLVLTEANLPDGTWMDVLELARQLPRDVEVIVTDRNADARFWAEALNLGAYDLLAQPFYAPEVRRIVSYACSRPQAGKVSMAAL